MSVIVRAGPTHDEFNMVEMGTSCNTKNRFNLCILQIIN